MPRLARHDGYRWRCEFVSRIHIAFKQMEELTRIAGGPSCGELRLISMWDPLRGDPRFEKIVASLGPKDGNSK
jgi:hypothetical protein